MQDRHQFSDKPSNSCLMSDLEHLAGRLAVTYHARKTQRDRREKLTQILQGTELLLLTFTTGTIISTILGAGQAYQITSAVLAFLATLLTLYQYKINPEEKLRQRATAIEDFLNLSDRCESLITDVEDNAIDDVTARVRREALKAEYADKSKAAHHVSEAEWYAAHQELIVNSPMWLKKGARRGLFQRVSGQDRPQIPEVQHSGS